MLCVFGNKVLPLHHISLLFNLSSVNQIYYNAYIISIIAVIDINTNACNIQNIL